MGPRDDLPRAIGPYVALEEIGRGGMGIVYRGRRDMVGGASRRVAIKVVLPYATEAEMDGARRHFLREVRLAALLAHPNIVPVFDSGEFEDGLYLVMEYVEGKTLFAHLKAAQKHGLHFPHRVSFAIATSLLRALSVVHAARDESGQHLELVHRDVSPQNILLGNDGITRLTDFGLARAFAETALSNIHLVKGKLAYIAPEQFAGDTSAQSDVYSAGVVLWELLTARPYRAKPTSSDLASTVLKAPVPPSAFRPDLPAGTDAVLTRSLQAEPSLRYASATEMLAELAGVSPIASPEEVAAATEALAAASAQG